MQFDIEVPEGLNPELTALGWMVGTWEGTGNGTDHQGKDFAFEQRVSFQHNGSNYLYFTSQAFLLDGDTPAEPLAMETGFWRAFPDASVEVVLVNSGGWTEVLVGNVKLTQIDLRSDAVVRTQSSVIPQTAEQRLYGKVEGDLMYAIDRATSEHDLRPHMWARLTKVQDTAA